MVCDQPQLPPRGARSRPADPGPHAAGPAAHAHRRPPPPPRATLNRAPRLSPRRLGTEAHRAVGAAVTGLPGRTKQERIGGSSSQGVTTDAQPEPTVLACRPAWGVPLLLHHADLPGLRRNSTVRRQAAATPAQPGFVAVSLRRRG